MRPLNILLLSAVGANANADEHQSTMLGLSQSVGQVPVTSTERITYQCAFRNLWTKERHPINYPEEDAQWIGPIMWTHSKEFQPWAEGKLASPGVETLIKRGSGITLVQEMQQDPNLVLTYTENPDFVLSMGTEAQNERRTFVNMYPIQAKPEYPYLSAIASMQPSPDWFTGFYNVSLVEGGLWKEHIKFQSYVWDAGKAAGVTYEVHQGDPDSSSPYYPSFPGGGGIPGLPFGNPRLPESESSPQPAISAPEASHEPVERLEFPDNAPPGGELLAPDGQYVPVVAEWECFLHVGAKDMTLPSCDWFANPCCNETATVNCESRLPFDIAASISKEYQEVIDADLANGGDRGEDSDATTINLGVQSACSECDKTGNFCGIDGQCRIFSCDSFYRFAEPGLSGYDGETELVCLHTKEEQAHGVTSGCEPLFPFVAGAPGRHVSASFNQKCTASRNDGYSFECYQFQPGTDFSLFQRDAESSFPDCGSEGGNPKYFYNIASSNHFMGVGGELYPVVAGGSDEDGDTLWQTNAMDSFDLSMAMHSMYANVVIPTEDEDSNDGGGGGDTTVQLAAAVSSGAAGTVWDLVRGDPDLGNFTLALQLAGLDSVLASTNIQYTVLAPSNDAILKDHVFSTYISAADRWAHHLRTNLQLMIVPDQALSETQIFDKERTELESLNGTLAVSQSYETVNLLTMQTPNKHQASNGVLHVMNGVMKNYWREYTLRDVDQHEELQNGLSPALTRIGFDDPLNELVTLGTSWIAARNQAYLDDSVAVARGHHNTAMQELKAENNTDFQRDACMYNLIDINIYEQDIPRGSQMLVFPRNSAAHMLVTKDKVTGILRFNDAALERQEFADNGVTQIVTKPLVPPGLAMLVHYCAEYATINLKDLAQYYLSSKWDLRDLTRSIGTGQGNFSVFAPMKDGYGEFFVSDIGVRFSKMEWMRHLWDFLLHMTTEQAHSTWEWYQLVEDAGGYLSVKMLSGFNVTFQIDADDELTIDGACLLRPYDIKGVDGYVHLVEQVPLPPSVLYTIYDQTQQNLDMTTMARLIDTAQLGAFMDNLLPVTFFSAINSAWDVIIPTPDIENVLKNMIFELLWFDDYLANMNGETITAINGKKWAIQVFDDPGGQSLHYAPEKSPVKIYFSNLEGPEGLTNCTLVPGPNRTNILARTGIIHHVDCLFLDVNYPKADAPMATSASDPPSTMASAESQGMPAGPSLPPTATIAGGAQKSPHPSVFIANTVNHDFSGSRKRAFGPGRWQMLAVSLSWFLQA